MKTIAILLTVHNRKDKTLKCLADLYAQVLPDDYVFEVYLTNDGCTDGTPEVIKDFYPKVHLIDGDGTLFWNRGMLKAWEAASKASHFDFYLWLNDDTTLFANALAVLLQTSEILEHKSIVVGSTCEESDSTTITYGGRTAKGQLIKPIIGEALICTYFNGNIVLIPDFVFNKNALGDFDYGLRAKKIGINSYIAPGVLGSCNDHEVRLSTWCNPNQPFKKRWRAFRSPLGNNPEEYFIFERRHKGVLSATFHYITNHLRVFFPQIWN
jgi:GT2 family glycosyltransferase